MNRFVSRDLCQAINDRHRHSFRLLFKEIRGLRRLVIALIIGSQLFSSGAGFLSTHYWLNQKQGRSTAASPACIDYEQIRSDLDETRAQIRRLAAQSGCQETPSAKLEDTNDEKNP